MLVRAEALNRLEGCDLSQDAARLAALDQTLDACRGTEQFVRLTDKFRASHRFAELLTLAQGEAASQLAVDALAVLYASEQCRPEGLFDLALRSDDAELVSQTLAAMATAADPRGNELLLALALDADRPLAARRAAVKALGANAAGAEQLLQLAQRQEFPEQLKEAWAAALAAAPLPEIRTQAAALFPAPPTKDSTPLPSLAELVDSTGDAERGKVVFNATGTCRNCHQVNGDGTEVGPDLSEIGKKLARPAMFESILYPSAAISHNFENWVVLTDDGLVHGGLLVSETADELKLKDEKGIVRSIPTATIEEKSKSEASLMPADIQKLMTAAELVDLVEYLSTLKERRSVGGQ
jgi:putative heme-binding domain-containing protein